MRGSRFHNHILLDPVERFLSAAAWDTRREYPVSLAGGRGAIDLVAERDGSRIAIEVELTTDRVPGDIDKAIAAEAPFLLIVTPNAKVRGAVRRRLRRYRSVIDTAGLQAFALTQPQALSWIARSFPLFSTSFTTGKQHSNPPDGEDKP